MEFKKERSLSEKANEIRCKLSEALMEIFELNPANKRGISDACDLSSTAINNVLEPKAADVQFTTLLRVTLFLEASLTALELFWNRDAINELLEAGILDLDVAKKRIVVPKDYSDRLVMYLMRKAKQKKLK